MGDNGLKLDVGISKVSKATYLIIEIDVKVELEGKEEPGSGGTCL